MYNLIQHFREQFGAWLFIVGFWGKRSASLSKSLQFVVSDDVSVGYEVWAYMSTNLFIFYVALWFTYKTRRYFILGIYFLNHEAYSNLQIVCCFRPCKTTLVVVDDDLAGVEVADGGEGPPGEVEGGLGSRRRSAVGDLDGDRAAVAGVGHRARTARCTSARTRGRRPTARRSPPRSSCPGPGARSTRADAPFHACRRPYAAVRFRNNVISAKRTCVRV